MNRNAQITLAARGVSKARLHSPYARLPVSRHVATFSGLQEVLGSTDPKQCMGAADDAFAEWVACKNRERDIAERGGRLRQYPHLQAHNVL